MLPPHGHTGTILIVVHYCSHSVLTVLAVVPHTFVEYSYCLTEIVSGQARATASIASFPPWPRHVYYRDTTPTSLGVVV